MSDRCERMHSKKDTHGGNLAESDGQVIVFVPECHSDGVKVKQHCDDSAKVCRVKDKLEQRGRQQSNHGQFTPLYQPLSARRTGSTGHFNVWSSLRRRCRVRVMQNNLRWEG